MIHTVEGDILLTRAQAIAHGVAPMDPMDQGLAKSLHERYPAMHKDFHHWCHQQHPKPGEAWMWGGPNGIRIINLLTQDGGYGRGARPGKATETAVNHSLRALRKMVKMEKIGSLALPRLATGVGGLEWNQVRPLIDSQLGELRVPIYLYVTYRPGVQAEEPGLD
ncbi:MAG TPA: Appr-1-p processing protein [Chromatiaceae bacterium]|nr:Appr-1-p processing protein [Chromatiaceae bacterium]